MLNKKEDPEKDKDDKNIVYKGNNTSTSLIFLKGYQLNKDQIK